MTDARNEFSSLFDYLPTELCLQIASSLNVSGLMALDLVSKRFNHIVRDDLLWKVKCEQTMQNFQVKAHAMMGRSKWYLFFKKQYPCAVDVLRGAANYKQYHIINEIMPLLAVDLNAALNQTKELSARKWLESLK